MLKLIKNKSPIEFETRERCFISEILNDEAVPGHSIARCRVKPGVTTELHSLTNTRETYTIETGQGMMDDGECEPFLVGPGDSVEILPDHPQRIKNISDVDLVILLVCIPRFVPECYVALEGV